VQYKAADYVKLTTGFHAKANSLFQAILGPCNLGAPMTNGLIKVRGTYIENSKE
jgi:hypothetical protein